METIMPVLDMEVLKQKTNEYAMKGAIKSIEDYYTGYNSPFRKAIDEELNKHEVGTGIELPDIIALINETLSKEIDTIANTAISKSFLPLVQKFLTRVEKDVKFSDVLREFINEMWEKKREEYNVSVEKNEQYGWYDVELSCGDKNYKLTLHEDYQTKKEQVKKYQFLSLPYDYSKNSYQQTMKLSIDGGGVLELPFRKDILDDKFTSYIARLIMCSSKITLDTTEFDDEMFPERCHCD